MQRQGQDAEDHGHHEHQLERKRTIGAGPIRPLVDEFHGLKFRSRLFPEHRDVAQGLL